MYFEISHVGRISATESFLDVLNDTTKVVQDSDKVALVRNAYEASLNGIKEIMFAQSASNMENVEKSSAAGDEKRQIKVTVA